MSLKAKLVWQINLSPLIGRRVTVETHDGHYRGGVLSKIEWAESTILGIECQYPAGICFDGESSDSIPWALIKNIRLAKTPKPKA